MEIKEVKTKRDLWQFINLPAKINKNNKNWLPPLYIDEWNYYNPQKNAAFSYCDTKLLLAYFDGKLVGRIMGIINNRYNKLHNEKTARFTWLDAYNDYEIVDSLLVYIEKWAKEKGMDQLIGPFGFSDKDPEGLLIDGFEHKPVLVTPSNQSYLPLLVEKAGYKKKVDCIDYSIELGNNKFDVYYRLLSRINKNDFKLIEFKKRRELKKYIIPVLELLNECYIDIYGFDKLEEKEMLIFAKRYLPLLNPGFVKVVLKGDELVGFVIAMPDLAEGIMKAKGRLFPFGFYYIFKAFYKPKQLVLMLGGVKKELRGRGIDVILGLKIMEACRQKNINRLESHLILETNIKMRAEVERIGGKPIKRFRIFCKEL